jgi:serine/threonine protein phosphatase PrpC
LITSTQTMPLHSASAGRFGSFKYLSVGRTHAGRVRTLNEDALLNRPDIGLWAVADGMGGHECGDVASAVVVDALAGVSRYATAYAFRDAVAGALKTANGELAERSALHGTTGATIVTVLTHGAHYACLWAGDSRAYLYRGGALRRLTRDHSLVQEMVDAGALSEAAARAHPKSNVITRAVGASGHLELDEVSGAIRQGDRFLLCSDGLTSVVQDREIAEAIVRAPLEAAAERLMELALGRCAPDNVTLLLIAAEPG